MQLEAISFREKKAWFTLGALVVVFTPFFIWMANAYHQPDPDIRYLAQMALIALSIFVVVEMAVIVIARFLSPDDVGIPKDERDQLFAYRAARIAYTALIVLVVLVTFPMIHLRGGNWGWGMAFLLAIILSEVTRAVVLIVQYRRGY